jgi:hypothetical protein
MESSIPEFVAAAVEAVAAVAAVAGAKKKRQACTSPHFSLRLFASFTALASEHCSGLQWKRERL